MNKFLTNKQQKKIIIEKIIEKCQFISKREVSKGKVKIIDRYYSIKDIELVLNELF